MKSTTAIHDHADILREIKQLHYLFDKLLIAGIRCKLHTERRTTFSRFPSRMRSPRAYTKAGSQAYFFPTEGLEVAARPARSMAEAETSTILFDAVGKPITDQDGRQILWAFPGILSSHFISLSGDNTEIADQVIRKASSWFYRRWRSLWPILFAEFQPSSFSENGAYWPDVVIRIAEISRSTLMKSPAWKIEINGVTIDIAIWKQRINLPKFFQYTVEDEERIGDNPEEFFLETDTLLSDSIEALDYLLRQFPEAGTESTPPAKPGSNSKKRDRSDDEVEQKEIEDALFKRWQEYSKQKGLPKNKTEAFLKANPDVANEYAEESFKALVDKVRKRQPKRKVNR